MKWRRLRLLVFSLPPLVACAHHGAEPLAVGTVAPDFAVTAHDGQRVTLSALRGRYVVLFFYPMDDTSGCTREACDFRDAWAPLQAAGVVPLGVSSQGNASHVDFAKKYNLPFALLPDEDGALAARYHVPTTMGLARRMSYLIDKDGKIKRVWPKVTPAGHASEILAAVRQP